MSLKELSCLSILFKKCDQSKTGLLEGKEIKYFYEILTGREEIGVIYETYAKTEGLMSAANLLDFLENEQKEKTDLTRAAQLIEKYEVDETGKHTAYSCIVSYLELNQSIHIDKLLPFF